MKIEKGKLYYDTTTNSVFKADKNGNTPDIEKNGVLVITDKIAVHCPNMEDWEYIKKQGYNLYQYWGGYSDEPHFILNGGGYVYLTHPNINKYHIITIDEFKKFYPPDEEQDPYMWGDKIVISNKKDAIVQNVIQKYQQRSDVGIQKYVTTLQDNNDGIEIFLTHLQEELMDATLYIEKLKNKFAQLKKEL